MQKFCEKCTFSMLATELIQSFLAEDLQKRTERIINIILFGMLRS